MRNLNLPKLVPISFQQQKRVGRLGFEPGMTEPKPVVLPLHHRPMHPYAGAKVVKIWQSAKFFTTLLLFNYQQVVILLAFLGQNILAVNQIFGRNSAVLIGNFFFVQTDTAPLYHLAHLAF